MEAVLNAVGLASAELGEALATMQDLLPFIAGQPVSTPIRRRAVILMRHFGLSLSEEIMAKASGPPRVHTAELVANVQHRR